jgi:hypothetical protein
MNMLSDRRARTTEKLTQGRLFSENEKKEGAINKRRIMPPSFNSFIVVNFSICEFFYLMATTTTSSTNKQPILIPIQTSQTKIPEWAMLELNGDLLLPHELSADENWELGSLQFSNSNKPVLICGTHEFQGTIEQLKQPFVVLQQDNDEEEGMIVQGVITHKLLFNRYPRTILS